MKEQQGYYYIIPADLVENGNKTQALLYGLITSLTLKQKYCTASNKYLAEKLGMKSEWSVSKHINALKDEGWLEVRIYRDRGNMREILPIVKFHKTSSGKTQDPSCGKTQESNISNSNKREYSEQSSHDNQLTTKRQPNNEDKVIEVFYKSINPTINWGNKTTRKAAADLIKRFGLDGTLKMAEMICSVQGKDRYAPVATTPHQMKEKLAQFKVYFDRQNNSNNRIVKI